MTQGRGGMARGESDVNNFDDPERPIGQGYLVDLAGEIALAFEDKIVLAAVDKVSRVDGQLTVLASKL